MTEPARLTAQTIRDAMQKIRDAPFAACLCSNGHVVHPVNFERGGWARCANCFQLVLISTPEQP